MVDAYSQPPSAPRMVGPAEAISRALRGVFRWGGRATRAEYWWWALVMTIIGIIFTMIRALLGPSDSVPAQIINIAVIVLTVWLGITSLGVASRRLHDVGRGVWWLIIGLILGLTAVPMLFAGIFAGAAVANGGDANTGNLLLLAGVGAPLLASAWGILLLVFYLLPSTKRPTKWDDGFRIS